MKYNKLLIHSICLLLILGFSKCKNTNTLQTVISNKIIFYIFSFKKVQFNTWSVSVKQQQIVDGSLKYVPTTADLVSDMRIDCLNDQNERMITYFTPDPFNKVVEFVDSLGQLKISQIDIDSSQQMLRIPFDPMIQSFRFKRNLPHDSSEYILKLTDL